MRELRIATRDLDGAGGASSASTAVGSASSGASTGSGAGGVTVLDLDGSLDKRTIPDLEKAMASLAEKGRLRLIVNCEKLGSISSDGMGVFLSHLIKIRKSGGDIKFCNMRDEARTVVSYLGLAKLLTIRDTEREALADFKKGEAGKEAAKEPDKLRIAIEERGAVTILGIHGFIDRHTIELLDKALRGLFDKGRPKLVIDCAELTYISSNGMGVFISYVNKARNLGGDIRFCAMRDIAKTVITMLGLHRLFEVFETRDAAIASFEK